jgi:hypothetical protein
VITAFRRWAFGPVDTAPMAAVRIACGLITIGWVLSFLPDVPAFLADDGLTSRSAQFNYAWWHADWLIDLLTPYGTLGVLLFAAVAHVLGWHTRIAAVLVAVLLIVLQRRDVYVNNSGDLLLRLLAIYVSLMPAGEVWSLDARRRGTSSPRAPWGLRLLQIQVSLIYLFSVAAKLHGDTWQDGSAVGRAVQLADLQRFLIPHDVATSVPISALLTYGTLIVEGALVFGLWLPRFRWVVMAAGVSIHLGIEATLLIGWFSFAIISTYLAFVPAEHLRTAVAYAGNRVRRQQPAPAPVPSTLATSGLLAGGQQHAHELGESPEVGLPPGQGVGVDERLGQPDHGVGDLVERHGEGEVVDVVDEELLDPVETLLVDHVDDLALAMPLDQVAYAVVRLSESYVYADALAGREPDLGALAQLVGMLLPAR